MVTPRRASPAGTGQVTHSPSGSSAHTAVGRGALGGLPAPVAPTPAGSASSGLRPATCWRCSRPRGPEAPYAQNLKTPNGAQRWSGPHGAEVGAGSPWELLGDAPRLPPRQGQEGSRPSSGPAQAAWTQTPLRGARQPLPACGCPQPSPGPAVGPAGRHPGCWPLGSRDGWGGPERRERLTAGPLGGGRGVQVLLAGCRAELGPACGERRAGLSRTGEGCAVLEGGPSAGLWAGRLALQEHPSAESTSWGSPSQTWDLQGIHSLFPHSQCVSTRQTPCPAVPGAWPLRGPSVNPGSRQLVRRHQASPGKQGAG